MDEVTYRWSPWRHALAMAALGFVCAAVVQLGATIMSLRPPGAMGLQFVVTYTVCFGLFSWLFTRGRPPRLTLGSEGIELAAGRRDGLLVPYAIVSSARVRWRWPITTVEVLVAAPDEPRVRRLHRGGRRPARRSRRGRVCYPLPIAGLRSAEAASIRAELERRGLVPDGAACRQAQ